MQPIRLDSQDLIEYNATYRILICRECQYAIQKSAVSSHLLRHKIYRDDRQRLLSNVAELDLAEPEDVILPTRDARPIDGMPVVPGYCCTLENCGNLCASLKRMKRHQSEMHGTSDLSDVDSFARPVVLQTFFRGTKLRYFEVKASASNIAVDSVCLDATDTYRDIVGPNKVVDDSVSKEGVRNATIPRSSLGTGSIDLETLVYFHHYITTTSLTLPAPRHSFWQEAVRVALGFEWLMCGLLAISAHHLAMSSSTPSSQQAHHNQADRLCSRFQLGYSEAISPDPDAMLQDDDDMVRELSGLVNVILCCARCTLTATTIGEVENHESFSLHGFITTIRKLAHIDAMEASNRNSDLQESMFAEAKKILDTSAAISVDHLDNRSMLLSRLRALPSKLSAILGRPDHVQDVLATLSATAALVVCCDNVFAGPEPWHAMTAWLKMVPETFHDMIADNNPAALVLVAYWAVLVKHVERCELWFFEHLSKLIVDEVNSKLKSKDMEFKALVRGLGI
jgi:hypothetical protein